MGCYWTPHLAFKAIWVLDQRNFSPKTSVFCCFWPKYAAFCHILFKYLSYTLSTHPIGTNIQPLLTQHTHICKLRLPTCTQNGQKWPQNAKLWSPINNKRRYEIFFSHFLLFISTYDYHLLPSNPSGQAKNFSTNLRRLWYHIFTN